MTFTITTPGAFAPQEFCSRLPAGLTKLAGMWFLVSLLLLLNGCASQLQTQSLASSPGELPRYVELSETPFHAQERHHCGPAALAMLLNANGVPAQPDDLAHLTYLPGRAGSLGVEMLATPRQFGLLGYKIRPDLETLLAEVAAGRPALVLQNLGLSWLPRWHYAVLIGYDLDRERVILRSGTTERETMPLNTFERTWLRGERWAMAVLPADQQPVRPDAVAFLQAAVGLEKVGQHAAAAQAYAQATQLWPENPSGWMGLGNNRYAMGNLVGAAQAFRHVVQLMEAHGPAHNNLAQVLLEQGDFDQAEQLVLQALAQQDGFADVYRQTLRDIRAQQAAQGNQQHREMR